MGKSSELFMQMREQEVPALEYNDDEHIYKEWITNLKSPAIVAIGKDVDGFNCFLSGDSANEVYELAKEHGVIYDLIIISPNKHIFKTE